jgi:hypothetical protein
MKIVVGKVMKVLKEVGRGREREKPGTAFLTSPPHPISWELGNSALRRETAGRT